MLVPIRVFKTIQSLAREKISFFHRVIEHKGSLSLYSSPSRSYKRELKDWHNLNKKLLSNDNSCSAVYLGLAESDIQKLLSLCRLKINTSGIVPDPFGIRPNMYTDLIFLKNAKSLFYKKAVKDGSLEGKFNFIGYNIHNNQYRKHLGKIRKLEDAIKYLKAGLKRNKPPKKRSFTKKVKALIWNISNK